VGEAFDVTANPNTGWTCCYAGVFQRALTQPGDGYGNVYSEFMFRGQNALLGLVPGAYTMTGGQPSWAHQLLYGSGPAIAINFPELYFTSCPWVLPPATFTILESQQAPDGRPQRLTAAGVGARTLSRLADVTMRPRGRQPGRWARGNAAAL
jgi:hypothetical protein